MSEDKLSPGDRFTITGFGTGAKGQTVCFGVNPATGRKCKAVKLTTYICQEPGPRGGTLLTPAILPDEEKPHE